MKPATTPQQQKALDALNDIKKEAKNLSISPKAAMKSVLKAQKKVRSERKKSRR